MTKDHDYYIGLLSAYIDQRLEPAQVEELFAFIQLEPMTYRSILDTPAIRQQLTDRSQNESITISDTTSQRMLEKLQKATRAATGNPNPGPRITRLRPRATWYAAAAILVIIASIYLLTPQTQKTTTEAPSLIADIQPGANKATLTLAGGKTIVLDSTSVGELAVQGNTTITRNADGQITYNAANTGAETALQNTLTTPRGGQYRLVLPDGTRVWVNAASSITYPTAFKNKERKVSIKGEAFFDIAQNKNQPFIVEVNNGPEIQVLGTQFNINAYTDEPSTRTTLIAGSVKVKYDNQSLVLKPNQQAATSTKNLILEPQPNIDEVLAWKYGSFLFDKAPLDVVMRQLSRWYDVDVVYTSGIPAIRFEGEMKRDLNLSEVLNILRKLEVHCKMDGRRLIVLP